MSLTAEQIANLRQLQDVLRTVPEEKYHHDRVFNNCGTPACAYGYAAAAGIGGLRAVNTPYGRFTDHDSLYKVYGTTDLVANVIFGDNAWNRVFNSHAYDDQAEEDCEVTPRMVIDRIDQFVGECS